MAGDLSWLQLCKQSIFQRDPQKEHAFRRFSLEQRGWFWLIFPRITVVEHESFTLKSIAATAAKEVSAALQKLGQEAQSTIREAVERSAKQRSGRARNAFNREVDALVLGTEELPAAFATEGRAAIQAVHRSMVEAAGTIGQKQFEQGIKECLAQMIVYARKEAGAGVSRDEQVTALPIGTRFVYRGDSTTIYFIEEAPRVRTIRWDRELVQLSFPYVVFALVLENGRYNNFHAFFRNEPLALPTDRLHRPPLPDLHPDLALCFPAPRVTRGAPADIAVSAQLSFWESSFSSHHLNAHYEASARKIPDFSLRTWRTTSSGRPLDVLKIRWLESGFTVASFGARAPAKATAFNAGRAMSRLERYSHDVSGALSLAIREAVVNAVSDEKGVAAARASFDEKMRTALHEAGIAQRMADLIRSELEKACTDAKISDTVAAVSKRAATQVQETINETLASALSAVADQLGGALQDQQPRREE
ncbi:MAG: hypothetical protein KBE09_01540 [Candidatus Pacebacteria bacterium]|nr:hypothetical protein [Candidatus Paceibacterota bacterium]